MEKQIVDHLTGENLVRIDSLKALTQGYILNCRCEGKSPKTVEFYGNNLNHFLWWLEQQGYTDDPAKIGPNHIRAFLTYVDTEPIRWGATSTTACRPASPITVRHSYRVLFTFFKWLQQEGLIADNPVAYIKTPKIEQKVIQALYPQEVHDLLSHKLINAVFIICEYRDGLLLLSTNVSSAVRVSIRLCSRLHLDPGRLPGH